MKKRVVREEEGREGRNRGGKVDDFVRWLSGWDEVDGALTRHERRSIKAGKFSQRWH